MKTRLPVLLLLSVLMFGACQPKSDPTAQVELASEPELEILQPLEASFMSDGQSFAYTLHYDGALMQIVDGQFDGATVVGPSFTVSGGSKVVVKSVPSSDLADWEKAAGAPQEVSGMSVYHSSELQGVCAMDTNVVPVSVESLMMTVTICDGQDSQLGQKALYSLLKGLEVKAL